jgi:hypothetical protein
MCILETCWNTSCEIQNRNTMTQMLKSWISTTRRNFNSAGHYSMCCHVYELNLCYDDDPVITIESCTSFSRPLLCRMQLCFRITTFAVAILLWWPELSLAWQHASVKYFLLEESCGCSPFLVIQAMNQNIIYTLKNLRLISPRTL